MAELRPILSVAIEFQHVFPVAVDLLSASPIVTVVMQGKATNIPLHMC
jgi:hypothetical protein